jgi:hypothetical protein
MDRLVRWQTPIVVGALCLLALATAVEGDWFTVAEYALLGVVCWWLGADDTTEGSRHVGSHLALGVAVVGVPLVLAIHVVDASWWRAGLWLLVGLGMLFTWSARRSPARA